MLVLVAAEGGIAGERAVRIVDVLVVVRLDLRIRALEVRHAGRPADRIVVLLVVHRVGRVLGVCIVVVVLLLAVTERRVVARSAGHAGGLLVVVRVAVGGWWLRVLGQRSEATHGAGGRGRWTGKRVRGLAVEALAELRHVRLSLLLDADGHLRVVWLLVKGQHGSLGSVCVRKGRGVRGCRRLVWIGERRVGSTALDEVRVWVEGVLVGKVILVGA